MFKASKFYNKHGQTNTRALEATISYNSSRIKEGNSVKRSRKQMVWKNCHGKNVFWSQPSFPAEFQYRTSKMSRF